MDEYSTAMKARRSMLKSAVWLAGIATMPILANTRIAMAQSKLARADVQYQDTPKEGKDCNGCLQFIPGATPAANGTCKVVEGVISPRAYCAAFTRKPNQG